MASHFASPAACIHSFLVGVVVFWWGPKPKRIVCKVFFRPVAGNLRSCNNIVIRTKPDRGNCKSSCIIWWRNGLFDHSFCLLISVKLAVSVVPKINIIYANVFDIINNI